MHIIIIIMITTRHGVRSVLTWLQDTKLRFNPPAFPI